MQLPGFYNTLAHPFNVTTSCHIVHPCTICARIHISYMYTSSQYWLTYNLLFYTNLFQGHSVYMSHEQWLSSAFVVILHLSLLIYQTQTNWMCIQSWELSLVEVTWSTESSVQPFRTRNCRLGEWKSSGPRSALSQNGLSWFSHTCIWVTMSQWWNINISIQHYV